MAAVGEFGKIWEKISLPPVFAVCSRPQAYFYLQFCLQLRVLFLFFELPPLKTYTKCSTLY